MKDATFPIDQFQAIFHRFLRLNDQFLDNAYPNATSDFALEPRNTQFPSDPIRYRAGTPDAGRILQVGLKVDYFAYPMTSFCSIMS